jgi:ribosomal protein S18 acetylase RimI-like enzyme
MPLKTVKSDKADDLQIRDVESRDRDEWIALWDGFVSAKPSEPGERDLGKVNWARISAPDCPMGCMVAVTSDQSLQGFVLYSLVCWSWSSKPVCYLLDIFVRPEARGRGTGRRLMERLGQIGRSEGWYKIFWMTEADNFAAQRLYRSLAKQMDYVRFDWPLDVE